VNPEGDPLERISRRSFARRIAAVSLLPVLVSPSRPQVETPSVVLPEKVAGYTPDAPERAAMARFLEDQEKALAPLRARALPNDLAPATVFRSTPSSGIVKKGTAPRTRNGTERSNGQ